MLAATTSAEATKDSTSPVRPPSPVLLGLDPSRGSHKGWVIPDSGEVVDDQVVCQTQGVYGADDIACGGRVEQQLPQATWSAGSHDPIESQSQEPMLRFDYTVVRLYRSRNAGLAITLKQCVILLKECLAHGCFGSSGDAYWSWPILTKVPPNWNAIKIEKLIRCFAEFNAPKFKDVAGEERKERMKGWIFSCRTYNDVVPRRQKCPDEYSFQARVARAAIELRVTTGPRLYNLRLHSSEFVDDMDFFESYAAQDCIEDFLPRPPRDIDLSDEVSESPACPIRAAHSAAGEEQCVMTFPIEANLAHIAALESEYAVYEDNLKAYEASGTLDSLLAHKRIESTIISARGHLSCAPSKTGISAIKFIFDEPDVFGPIDEKTAKQIDDRLTVNKMRWKRMGSGIRHEHAVRSCYGQDANGERARDSFDTKEGFYLCGMDVIEKDWDDLVSVKGQASWSVDYVYERSTLKRVLRRMAQQARLSGVQLDGWRIIDCLSDPDQLNIMIRGA